MRNHFSARRAARIDNAIINLASHFTATVENLPPEGKTGRARQEDVMRKKEMFRLVMLAVVLLVAAVFLFPLPEGQACQQPCGAPRHYGKSVTEIVCCMPSVKCKEQLVCFNPTFAEFLHWALWLLGLVTAAGIVWFGIRALGRSCLAPVLALAERNAGIIEALNKRTGEIDSRIGKLDGVLQGLTVKLDALTVQAGRAANDTASGLAEIKTAIAGISCRYPAQKTDAEAIQNCLNEMQKCLEGLKKKE
jgi:hypothetical protein